MKDFRDSNEIRDVGVVIDISYGPNSAKSSIYKTKVCMRYRVSGIGDNIILNTGNPCPENPDNPMNIAR